MATNTKKEQCLLITFCSQMTMENGKFSGGKILLQLTTAGYESRFYGLNSNRIELTKVNLSKVDLKRMREIEQDGYFKFDLSANYVSTIIVSNRISISVQIFRREKGVLITEDYRTFNY